MSFKAKYSRVARYYEALERPLDRFFCSLRERAVSLVKGKLWKSVLGLGKHYVIIRVMLSSAPSMPSLRHSKSP